MTNQLQIVLDFLQSKDSRMFKVIKEHSSYIQSPQKLPSELYFSRLVRTIVGQQLSVKAASTINSRLENLLGQHQDYVYQPADFELISDEALRGIGLSYQKIKYVRDLCRVLKAQEINLNNLHKLEDQEVIDELTQVKGIGIWSAEMFLIFALGRKDVFSSGDLGLMTAAARVYKLDRSADKQQIAENIKSLSPYRTFVSLGLWASLDNQPK